MGNYHHVSGMTSNPYSSAYTDLKEQLKILTALNEELPDSIQKIVDKHFEEWKEQVKKTAPPAQDAVQTSMRGLDPQVLW